MKSSQLCDLCQNVFSRPWYDNVQSESKTVANEESSLPLESDAASVNGVHADDSIAQVNDANLHDNTRLGSAVSVRHSSPSGHRDSNSFHSYPAGESSIGNDESYQDSSIPASVAEAVAMFGGPVNTRRRLRRQLRVMQSKDMQSEGTQSEGTTELESIPHHYAKDLETMSLRCPLCAILWDEMSWSLRHDQNHSRWLLASWAGAKGRASIEFEFDDSTAWLTVDYHMELGSSTGQKVLTGGLRLYSQEAQLLYTDETPFGGSTLTTSAEPAAPSLATSTPSQSYQSTSSETLRDETLQSIQGWLGDCHDSHIRCQKLSATKRVGAGSPRLPTRLLDVGSMEEPSLRLLETTGMQFTRYTTLSHCWGDAVRYKLLNDLYEGFRQNIEFSALSRTFRHAVEVTRALGIKHLWIDALCIIQNCSSDWNHEATLMASVYSYCTVNLAATNSMDGDGGLFPGTRSLLEFPCVVRGAILDNESVTYVCRGRDSWARHVENAPLNQRAWVLQERLLSPRTIHFAHKAIWLECGEKRWSQLTTALVENKVLNCVTDLEDVLLKGLDLDDWWERWNAIVEHFAAARLTIPTDRVVALSGVARVFQSALDLVDGSYLAGHWAEKLEMSLLWHVIERGGRLEPHMAPSWSWTSVEAAITFHIPRDDRGVHEFQAVTTVDRQVLGTFDDSVPSSIALLLRGPLFKMHLKSRDGSWSKIKWREGSESNVDGKLDRESDWESDRELDDEYREFGLCKARFRARLDDSSSEGSLPLEDRMVRFLLFRKWEEGRGNIHDKYPGLILGKDTEEAGVYRRLGLLEVDTGDSYSLFAPDSEFFLEAEPGDYIEAHEDRTCVIKLI